MPSPDEIAKRLKRRNQKVKTSNTDNLRRAARGKPKAKPKKRGRSSVTSADVAAEQRHKKRIARSAVDSRIKRGVAGKADTRLLKRSGQKLKKSDRKAGLTVDDLF